MKVNRRQPASVTATDAKKRFGRLLEKAIQGNDVFITKHDAPKAVLISVDRFNALSRDAESKMDSLNTEFDVLLSRMQQPGARDAMQSAFNASPKELAKAALTAARKRG